MRRGTQADRFTFGENWTQFAYQLDKSDIAQAEASLRPAASRRSVTC